MIELGSVVKYSRVFLRSIGVYTGDMPFAKGRVTGFVKLPHTKLAEIAWGIGSTGKVNVKNLVLASDPERI